MFVLTPHVLRKASTLLRTALLTSWSSYMLLGLIIEDSLTPNADRLADMLVLINSFGSHIEGSLEPTEDRLDVLFVIIHSVGPHNGVSALGQVLPPWARPLVLQNIYRDHFLAGTKYIPVENFSIESVFLYPELLRAEIRGVYFVVLCLAICSVGCLKSKTFQGNSLS